MAINKVLILSLLFIYSLVAYASPDAKEQDSIIFKQHSIYKPIFQIPSNSDQPVKYDIQQVRNGESAYPDWFKVYLYALLLILATTFVAFRKDIVDILEAYSNLNMVKQLSRDQELSLPLSAILLNSCFVLGLAAFIYVAAIRSGYGDSSFYSLIINTVLLALIFAFKYLILNFLSKILSSKELSHYNFNFFIQNKVLAMMLVPASFGIAFGSFSNAFLWISYVLLTIHILYSIVASIRLSGKVIFFHSFHFFIYICTLEIAPAMFIIKIFKGLLA